MLWEALHDYPYTVWAFDGFEEVSDNGKLLKQLNSLQWAPLKVVASQPTSVPIVLGALEFELEPYDLDDILQVISQAGHNVSGSFADYIREHEDIALLMQTPLLCDPIIYLHAHGVAIMQLSNRADVIEQLVQLTVQNAILCTPINDAKPSPIQESELDWFSIATLVHYHSNRRHKPFDVDSENIQSSGWLQKVPSSLGKFEFVHPNFLEYFAYHGLVRVAPEDLIEFVDESLLNVSVLGFLHHLLSGPAKRQLIEHISKQTIERLTMSTSLFELCESDALSYCQALCAVVHTKSEQITIRELLTNELDLYHDASLHLLMLEIAKDWSHLKKLFCVLSQRIFASPFDMHTLVNDIVLRGCFRLL
jgi:hypothetical protein